MCPILLEEFRLQQEYDRDYDRLVVVDSVYWKLWKTKLHMNNLFSDKNYMCYRGKLIEHKNSSSMLRLRLSSLQH